MSLACSRANNLRLLTQPPRLVETVTSGEVVTMRSASGVAAPDLGQDQAEALLGGHQAFAFGWGRLSGIGCGGASIAPFAAARTARSSERLRSLRRLEAGPRTCPIHASRAWLAARNVAICAGHQAGVIVLVTWQRQAEAFHRIGDEQRPVVISRGSRMPAEAWHVMAAQIGHQRRQFLVAALGDQRVTGPWSPNSSVRRLRQAAPPWNSSEE